MTTQLKFNISCVRFLAVLCILFSAACGEQIVDSKIRAKVPTQNIVEPTAANIDRWWAGWDKKTLILGVLESKDTTHTSGLESLQLSTASSILRHQFDQSLMSSERLSRMNQIFAEELLFERQSLLPDAQAIVGPTTGEVLQQESSSFQLSTYFLSISSIPVGLKRLSTLGLLPSAIREEFALPTRAGVVHLMNSLKRSGSVQWVEPNLVSYLSRQDRYKKNSDGSLGIAPEFKYNTSIVSVLKRVRADSAYSFVEQTKPNLSSVTVAVLDTGVDSEHPELKDQMFVNPAETVDGIDNDNNCFVDDIHGVDATVECGRDDSVIVRPGHADLGGPGKQCPRVRANDELSANCGHGSHVAGIVAAKHGGDLSTIGICPSCKILSIRVAERCIQPATSEAGECRRPLTAYDPLQSYEVDGGISDASQIRALTYLYNLRAPDDRNRLLVNVVNLSLGKYFASRSMSYIIRNLQRKNIIVVAAAGNDGTESPSYPAAYDSVVAVCATSEDYVKGAYGRAPFSNFGDWVDICAPGTDIVSTTPGKTFDGGGLFIDKTGTSQATPFVAGALGYLLSYYGNQKSSAQIVQILKDGADSEIIYNAQSNRFEGSNERLYRACYSETSKCDNLLGAGFLDLDAAVQGRKQSQTNFDFLSNQPFGCVVNNVARAIRVPLNVEIMWLSTSMPALLLFAYGCLRLRGIRSVYEKVRRLFQ